MGVTNGMIPRYNGRINHPQSQPMRVSYPLSIMRSIQYLSCLFLSMQAHVSLARRSICRIGLAANIFSKEERRETIDLRAHKMSSSVTGVFNLGLDAKLAKGSFCTLGIGQPVRSRASSLQMLTSRNGWIDRLV